MPINYAIPIAPAISTSVAPADSRNWQIGQILNATVLTPISGQTTLRIGNIVLSTSTPLAVDLGQSLRLQVLSLGEQPVLRIVTAQQPPAAQPDTVMLQALRVALPKQTPLAPLLTSLDQLAHAAHNTTPALTPQSRELIRQIINNLSTSSAVASAQGVLQALKNSGVLLEGKLARNSDVGELAGDFKAGLLRLREALLNETAPGKPLSSEGVVTAKNTPGPGDSLVPANLPVKPSAAEATPRPAVLASLDDGQDSALSGKTIQNPGELLRQVEGGLARIQFHQLSSLAAENTTPLMVDLPVRQGQRTDVFHLTIDPGKESAKSTGDEPPPCSVRLNFNLPGLGPISSVITLYGERVTSVFWAEQEPTVALLNRHMVQLHSGLEQAGLSVERAECLPGNPPSQAGTSPMQLMNIRA